MTPFAAKLAAYLLSAASAWVGIPEDCESTPRACVAWENAFAEPPDDAAARLRERTEDLAREADDRDGAGIRRERLALDLLAIEREESLFARRVDDGTCNRSDLPPLLAARVRRGWCDFGKAFSMFQFHPDTLADVRRRPPSGEELVGSHALAVSVAWDLRERRPMAWATWPKASARAAEWAARHPLP